MHPYFDHEKLRVYRKAIEFAGWASALLLSASPPASLRSQLERAAASIALNIAEGNGKTMKRDRCRFLEIARGSALECAACLDIMVAMAGVGTDRVADGKELLRETVAMLTRLMVSLSERAKEEDGHYAILPQQEQQTAEQE